MIYLSRCFESGGRILLCYIYQYIEIHTKVFCFRTDMLNMLGKFIGCQYYHDSLVEAVFQDDRVDEG